jgi:hypothetical protein
VEARTGNPQLVQCQLANTAQEFHHGQGNFLVQIGREGEYSEHLGIGPFTATTRALRGSPQVPTFRQHSLGRQISGCGVSFKARRQDNYPVKSGKQNPIAASISEMGILQHLSL